MVERRLAVQSFWCKAHEFFEADTYLPEKRCPIIHFYLLCHSLELCLKAFLADQGIPHKELSQRPFGHDLDRLFRECEKHELGAIFVGMADIRELIQATNEDYNKKHFEYSDKGKLELPDDFKKPRESIRSLLNATKDLWIEPAREMAARKLRTPQSGS